MKKNILAVLMLAAVLVVSGCSKRDSGEAFGYNNGELMLTPGDKFNAEAGSLAETTAYMEAASCYFDGFSTSPEKICRTVPSGMPDKSAICLSVYPISFFFTRIS